MQSLKNLLTGLAVVVTVLPVPTDARTLIQNKGSDTLVNVAQAWDEAYREKNADVAVEVSGGGSGTGIAAM
ncbi:MAG: phosphate-binding protein, partial [Gammaproteobacteria bacterium]